MQELCKNKAKLLAFFLSFVVLLIIPFSIAQPPFQQISGNDGLLIEYPSVEYLKLNQHFRIDINVLNTSGTIMTDTSTSCVFHLKNSSGDHLLKDNMSYDGEFHYTINKTFLSEIGVKPYQIKCNTSNYGGIAAGTFEVTSTGTATDEQAAKQNSFNKIWVLGIILFISLFFIWLAATYEDSWSAVFAGFLIVYVGLNIAINGVGDFNTQLTNAFSVILIGFGVYIGFKGIEGTGFGENFGGKNE